jgi:hypothetical protein
VDPVALRAHRELAGWGAFDRPSRHGGAAWCARDMALLFRLCERRDAKLRDLIGAGHAPASDRLVNLLLPPMRFGYDPGNSAAVAGDNDGFTAFHLIEEPGKVCFCV